MKMLTIDVGNSSIKVTRIAVGQIESYTRLNDRNFAQKIDFDGVYAVIISSVNPKVLSLVLAQIQKRFQGSVFQLNYQSPFGFTNAYRPPAAVGIDRLCGAEGAVFLHRLSSGADEATIMTVDFGTATTINVIEQGAFIGGFIIPGARLALKSLSQDTALLPNPELELSIPVIGNDTKNCMISGVIQSGVALVERTYHILEQRSGASPEVFITGGNADYFLPELRIPHTFMKELTSLGMYSVGLKLLELKEKN
jgi:type III pantothenate kinase